MLLAVVTLVSACSARILSAIAITFGSVPAGSSVVLESGLFSEAYAVKDKVNSTMRIEAARHRLNFICLLLREVAGRQCLRRRMTVRVQLSVEDYPLSKMHDAFYAAPL
jgi:hypothetical protein